MSVEERATDEHRGQFWLPEAPERRIGGAVQFGPRLAARLVFDDELFPAVAPVALVHGVFFDGRRVSAIKGYESNRLTRFGDTRHIQQTVDFETLLIGEHVDEQPRFNHLAVRLTLLRDWANVRSGWETEVREESGYSIRYVGPPDRTVTLSDGRRVTLRTVDRLSHSGQAIQGEQETIFMVEFPEPGSLADVGKAVANLQNLITFAARRPSKVVGLTVTCPGVFVAPGVEIPRELELRTFQVSLDVTPADASVSFAERDFLFLAPETPEEFGGIVQHWVDLEERLGVVLALFLSLLYVPPHHLENKLMSMCQTAEGYHRRLLDYELMPAAEHRALVAALLKCCPKPRRSWLSGVLAHSNGPSFKVRIEGLVAKSGAIGAALASTFESYPKSLRDFRNLYAHWPEDLAPTTAEKVPELVDLFDATKVILDTCLLVDLGWTEGEAAGALSGKRDFERLMRRPRVEVVQPN